MFSAFTSTYPSAVKVVKDGPSREKTGKAGKSGRRKRSDDFDMGDEDRKPDVEYQVNAEVEMPEGEPQSAPVLCLRLLLSVAAYMWSVCIHRELIAAVLCLGSFRSWSSHC